MHFNILKKTKVSSRLFNMFFLFSIFFVSSMLFLKTTAYAAVPYTYTITNNSATQNTLEITFDYPITIAKAAEITVYQTGVTSGNAAMITPKIITSEVSSSNTNVLDVTIGALDPTVLNYAIEIDKGALTFSSSSGYTQLTNFIIPFSSEDCATGFDSVFMNQSSLNDNIFAYNAPSDINVYVPKTYITSIETIHKPNGLVIPTTGTTTTPVTTTYPSLTSISVKTDPAVKRLKVSVTDSKGLTALDNMELFSSSSSVGFTTGQAGINIDTAGSDYTIIIMAYDVDGKLLQSSSYNKKVQSLETVSDYVPKASTSAGKAVTLYTLMKTQATLTSILTSFEPNNLGLIKVVYPNTANTRLISNSQGESNDAANVLAKALSDNGVQYIKFVSALNITPVNDVVLSRPIISSAGENVVLDGTGSTINGNVTIGAGDDNVYDLRNLTINGNLTVNVTGAGDCTLTNVTVKGTKTITKSKKAVVTGVVSMDDTSVHKIGDTIKIGVEFSEPVFVAGNPELELNISNGGTPEYASYITPTAPTTSTNEVVFDYIVKAGDVFVNSNVSLSSFGISLNNGDIQASDGAADVSVDYTLAGSTGSPVPIYSSTSNKAILVDGIRPTSSTWAVSTTAKPLANNVIAFTASEPLDRASAETASNWTIMHNGGGSYTAYSPLQVVLQGDNKTVMLIMPSDVSSYTSLNTQIYMGNVMDIAQNPANDNVPAGATTEAAKITASALGTTTTVGDAANVLLAKAQALVSTGYTVTVKSADGTYIDATGASIAAGTGTIKFTVTNTTTAYDTADTGILNITVAAVNAGATAEEAKITASTLGTITVGDVSTVIAKAKALVGTGYTVTVKSADGTYIDATGAAKKAGAGTITFTVTNTTKASDTADTGTLNITVN